MQHFWCQFVLSWVLTLSLVAAWYKPSVNTTWQIQYEGSLLDESWAVDVYDIDGFNASKALIDGLHTQGRRVICYFSAGSVESYVPDASSFPASVQGKVMDGWPDEKWLDVRNLDVVGYPRIVKHRF